MTSKELKQVGLVVRSILNSTHLCALNKKVAKDMKLKEGQLCDDCEAFAKAYIKLITG